MTTAVQERRWLDLPEQGRARVALERLVVGGKAAPTLVMVHGPAGSGKSRLVSRFADAVLSARDFDIEALGEVVGVLAVEDVQFLPRTRVESLVALLDERDALGAATIVTASTGPRHLRFRGERVAARLSSRLAAGLVVPVALPGDDSRRAVAQAWLADDGRSPTPEVVDALVAAARGFRELDGVLNQLKTMTSLPEISEADIIAHFRDHARGKRATVDRIVQRVAGAFRVAAKDIRSKRRLRGLVVPRHVSMYLARRLTSLPFSEIAAHFGDCDHATVLHACRKMELTLVDDPVLGGTIEQLQAELM